MQNFFDRIYDVVKKIPKGKVMTYGQVALVIGTRDARKVGWALHANTDIKIPCHRVVNKDGMLAKTYAFGGEKEQKLKLLSEGVTFLSNGYVDMQKCAIINNNEKRIFS